MIKATVFAVGLLASSVALADPFMDAPASGVRASYTLSFGGSGSLPLSHSLALSSGLTAGTVNAPKVMELRWAGQDSEFLVAGRPFAATALNANDDDSNQKWGWFTDPQALYLMAAAATLGIAIVVTNYRDSNGDIGTGSSN